MKRLSLLALLVVLLASCKSEPSLQKYIVESEQKKDFVAVDLSTDILNIKPEALTPEQRNAMESFDKVNVLAFKATDSNATEYAEESKKIKELLKGEKYQELMHFGSGKDGGSISYVGADDDIKEFVIFANRKENGFAVVRVLGDGMSPNAIMEMLPVLQKSNLDMEQLKPLQALIDKK